METAAPVRLLNVQGLRAYGALAVAFYHTGFSLGIGHPIGSFGVGVFFVISGFIMAMICDTNPEHFLARRVARIVPLYWLLTLVVFLLATVAPGLLGATTADATSLFKSLFFIPYLNHGTYFPILFLGWSLNYEMYFYLLIAAALAVNKRSAPLIAAGVMVAVLAGLRVAHVGGAATFYAQPIILEFVLGIFCYYGFRVISAERILAHRVLLVCAALIAAVAMIASATISVGTRNAIVVAVASTILVFCAVLLDKVSYSLRWPLLILLGDASYVIYLIHPYCEEALNKILGRSFAILSTRTALGMPLALAATIAASILVYRFVDNPLHLFFRKALPGKRELLDAGRAQPQTDRAEVA